MVDMLKVYSQYFHIMLLPSQKPSSPDGYAILGGVPVPPNPKNPGSWILDPPLGNLRQTE